MSVSGCSSRQAGSAPGERRSWSLTTRASRVRSACDTLRQVTATHGHERQTGSPVEQTDLDVFRLLIGSLSDSQTGSQGRGQTADLPLFSLANKAR
jgi:hypothetical protein